MTTDFSRDAFPDSVSLDCEWFVYAQDRHEGPFSTDQVRQRFENGTLSSSDHLWKEGMSGWVPVIDALSNPAPMPVPPPVRSAAPRPAYRAYAKRKHSPKRKPDLKWASVPLAVAIGFILFSSRAGVAPRSAGARLLLSMPASTSFAIWTDLPDGSPIQLRVEGVAGTLVGLPRYAAEELIFAKNGSAQTHPFLAEGQRSLPPGEYQVTVEGPRGDGRGEMASASFFLGGVRDEEYARQLAAYHEVVREQARTELSELKQYVATLENQLIQTDRTFQTLWEQGRRESKTAERSWKSFHRGWKALEDQLNDESQRASGGDSQFKELFELARDARDRVSEVHRLQDSYFSVGPNRADLEEKIAEMASIAESAVLSFKLKVSLAEKGQSR